MKRLSAALVVVVLISAAAPGQHADGNGSYYMNTNVQTNPSQSQNTQAIGGGNAVSSATSDSIAWAGGGSANATGGESASNSVLVFSPTTNSTSNYKSRTPPLTTYPPYLPVWNHGGWGTIKAYFPNGPTNHDRVYERVFDPTNEEDMDEVRGILHSLPYTGPIKLLGGVVNGVQRLFGGPDQSHHGRGFDIANGVIRDRRPEGKPLLVFIDSYIDPVRLEDEGYAYVGRLSLEGDADRNWDQVYNAAVAEALPWDVDILLISGGMKGVTAGATTSMSAGGGYSQTNYSLSLFGGRTTGVTEGKGEAVMSATAYRYCPEKIARRRIPQSLYDRIRVRPQTAAAVSTAPAASAATTVRATASVPVPAATTTTRTTVTAPVAVEEELELGLTTEEEYVPAPETTTRPLTGVDVNQDLYRMAFP